LTGPDARAHHAKKRSLKALEQEREDVAAERVGFRSEVAEVDPTRFVFVDETAVTTDRVRLYARAPRNERAVGTAPAGSYERLTLLGGLSLQGLVASMSLKGSADADVVVAFTEYILVPALVPGQIVCMDDLSAHKDPRVRELIEAAGCELRFLPRDSPDFNPIEQAWSKLKGLLRSAAARTKAALEAALTELIGCITAADAHGFFQHSGYAPAAN
jgi:transposase